MSKSKTIKKLKKQLRKEAVRTNDNFMYAANMTARARGAESERDFWKAESTRIHDLITKDRIHKYE